MRNFLVATLMMALPIGASAASATDLSPVECAWTKLSPEEQTKLRDEFQNKNTGKDALLHYPVAPSDQVSRVAAACDLSYDEAQMKHFAAALGARGGEEFARWGLGQRGYVSPSLVDKTVTSMGEDKRLAIGDTLSCGKGYIPRDWDKSAVRAATRAGVRTRDGGSMILMNLAVFSVFNQEGYMRRINGSAASCTE